MTNTNTRPLPPSHPYSTNFLLVVCICFRWPITHSYSPNSVLSRPSCRYFSFRVNRGPSSWSRARVLMAILVLAALLTGHASLYVCPHLLIGEVGVLLLLVYVAVVPDEDEVPLVVEGHHLSALVLRLLYSIQWVR